MNGHLDRPIHAITTSNAYLHVMATSQEPGKHFAACRSSKRFNKAEDIIIMSGKPWSLQTRRGYLNSRTTRTLIYAMR
jgi:hypothetical protein